MGRPSRSAVIFPFWMRCTQYVHFSITPRPRTVTSGLCISLGLAGDDTGIATHARRRVDCHAPGVTRIVDLRVKRSGGSWLVGVDVIGMFCVIVERRGADQRAVLHIVVALGGHERILRAGFD